MKHVLIIEDNSIIARMIAEYLADFGFASADFAETQDDAIRLARQRVPDLVTADYRLREGFGVVAVRHICQEKAVPVVFVVADPKQVQRDVPNAIYLLKPFSGEALERAVRAAEKLPLKFQ